jgi:hypothetical protein
MERKASSSDNPSAAPMNMVKPNKTRVDNFPPTPPRSVSFSNEIIIKYATSLNTPVNTNSNDLAISPAESIDIAVRDLSQDILVALVDRDVEMRELFVRNQEFFDTVKQSIFEDDDGWENFLKVLYSKREIIPDSEWMNSISEFLSPNPPFLVKFKEIIGFYDDDDDNVQEENEEFYSCDMMNDGFLDITPIRDFVDHLEESYPQFFINTREQLCKERQRKGSFLGGNYLCNDNSPLHPNVEDQCSDKPSETLYDEFKRILLTPRSEMDDSEWETAIYECLDPWPLLIAQFEEIVKYEISE